MINNNVYCLKVDVQQAPSSNVCSQSEIYFQGSDRRYICIGSGNGSALNKQKACICAKGDTVLSSIHAPPSLKELLAYSVFKSSHVWYMYDDMNLRHITVTLLKRHGAPNNGYTVVVLNSSLKLTTMESSQLKSTAPLWIHRWPVDSSHKGPVMWNAFPCDDVIMQLQCWYCLNLCCQS